ncbi:vacuolar membrane-associated protein IML1 [Ascosphaera apis ARSEF 7405]|uniref:Vacuolar membrane-associated protein IML1 n=1 Tax=Ascosphaera apis ARSEF 7405 TaxID=392613 RepID=A0A162IST6_9EURO|nr:vacuolar membrane-associated protein IML1 [Ascosphaera apis ARSEF 7405]
MPNRGPSRSSHLRNMSAASPGSEHTSLQGSQSTTSGTARLLSSPITSITQRVCTLWVHDESFSREDVLLNLEAFSDLAINVGDLVEVSPSPQAARQREPHSSTYGRHKSDCSHSATIASDNSYVDGASVNESSVSSNTGLVFLVKSLSPELRARQPNLQISIASNVANQFGFKNRMSVLIALQERSQCAASHVELIFRDQFLLRADQWRLTMSELAEKTIYKGQKILYMGTIRATVKNIYRNQKKVQSAYFSSRTIPIFRSESARYVLFIQMSKEMWDFDAEGTGDILFSRVINSLLPELFKRWAAIDAHHLVTVVLFTRIQYDPVSNEAPAALGSIPLKQPQTRLEQESQDYYRVVVNDMPSGNWTTILDQLKSEFRVFLRDVSIPQINFPDTILSAEDISPRREDDPPRISGRPTSATRGNILQAINLASSYLEHEHTGRDITRTGTSVVVITPGQGVFEVDYDALALTSEVLTSRAIGLDLICLSPQPLHAVPLFKYKPPTRAASANVQSPHAGYTKDPLDFLSQDLHSDDSIHSPGTVTTPTFPSSPLISDPDGWVYGMPHWIDVSFWDPKVYHETGLAVNRIMQSSIPGTVTKQSQIFIPRVRMYEIQMMGVMESEQSNISLPYLSPYSLQNKALCNTNAYPQHCIHPERYSMAATYNISKENILIPKLLTQSFMDSYDWQIFHTGLRCKEAHRRRRLLRDGHDTRPSNLLDLQYSNPSHIRGYESKPRNIGATSDAMAGMQRGSSSFSGGPMQKPSMKSSFDTPPRAKISRKISFALRGLGPAPPRAVPSTEINVEHARATNSSRENSITKISEEPLQTSNTGSPSSMQSPQVSPYKQLSPIGPSRRGHSQHTPLTPSKPISIRPELTRSRGTGSSDDIRGVPPRNAPSNHHNNDHDMNIARGRVFPFRRTGPKVDYSSLSRDEAENDPVKALAPWIISVNPCQRKGPIRPSWFGRWQHVYARMPHASSVKWKSLKSPAILPLTTEEFPSKTELNSDYYQTPYRVNENDEYDSQDGRKSREALLMEMIGLRLSHGFQIVVGKAVEEASGQSSSDAFKVFSPTALSRDNTTIYMSMGNIIHRLVCSAGGEIEVTRYTRKSSALFSGPVTTNPSLYMPAVKTILSAQYCRSTVNLRMPREDYNWNYVDAYLAGHHDHLWDPERQLRFWSARFVLIPVSIPTHGRRVLLTRGEDNEEEIHLLGINQLTNLWQKNRYVAPEEKQVSSRYRKEVQNPLNIIFQTSNPSEVVAAELGRLLIERQDFDTTPAQLLPDSELFERSNLSLSALAQAMQGEDGVRMMDRRWHFRLHYNCFVGAEFTTWIVQNFRDIDTREEAVAFGNELMAHGLFRHVRQEHHFRDGNYFYQVLGEYQIPRQESKSSWFPKIAGDKPTTPSTPASDSHTPSGDQGRRGSVASCGDSHKAKPSRPNRTRASVFLSKSMKYDLDPRKRSNRPEVVTLHYDRLHNPDNCFHFQLSWLNITPKLVEDAIASWGSIAEKYGLKLVEVPVTEASAIVDSQVFRRPYPIRLKVDPIGLTNFESSKSFSADVDVQYSWGKPNYKHHQYIHRSGCVLVQITDEGYFLLAANHLFNSRLSTKEASRFDRDHNRPRASTLDLISPRLSPIPSAIGIGESLASHPSLVDSQNVFRAAAELRDELYNFCQNEKQLKYFFSAEAANLAHGSMATVPHPVSEVKSTSGFQPRVEPLWSSMTESSIPTLELPEGLFQSPIRHPLPRPTSSARTSSRKPSVDSTSTDVRGGLRQEPPPRSPAFRTPE